MNGCHNDVYTKDLKGIDSASIERMNPELRDTKLAMTTKVAIHGELFEVTVEDSTQKNFWKNVSTWEPETFSFVESCARPGTTFIDVGAWIGPITLLAARRGAHVISLEPDRIALLALEKNICLNHLSPTILNAALHTHDNGVVLNAGPTGFGKSVSSSLTLPGDRLQQEMVTSITAQQLVKRIPKCHNEVAFKVDIEGHEYLVGKCIASVVSELRNSGIRVRMSMSVHPKLLMLAQNQGNSRQSRLYVREETRRLLEAFGPDSRFLCSDGVYRSVWRTLWRYLPVYRKKLNNFTVVLNS